MKRAAAAALFLVIFPATTATAALLLLDRLVGPALGFRLELVFVQAQAPHALHHRLETLVHQEIDASFRIAAVLGLLARRHAGQDLDPLVHVRDAPDMELP